MESFFKKHGIVTIALINCVLLLIIVAIAETALRYFFPFSFATIGHAQCDNATRYGWGFSPHELIRVSDPDTGQVYTGMANNHGWRDKDRSYENKSGAYRILVLGDSISFGAIVPEDKIYTRILEASLRGDGYNAEVITIAYGGWGTDQELEALLNEGLRYKPNLIIVQFCTNDIRDNAYMKFAHPPEKGWMERRRLKPFYFEVDDKNVLRRRVNPYFCHKPKERVVRLLARSEIFKRIYSLYLSHKHTSRVGSMLGESYKITANQLQQLEVAAGLRKGSDLHSYLRGNMNRRLPEDTLYAQIELSGYGSKKDMICRILEDRWFHESWSSEEYYPRRSDGESYGWKLYIALIREIKNRADSIAADVAILSETDEGLLQWSLSWHRISEDDDARANYYSYIPILRSLKNCGIDIINSTSPYKRARNDPHPNIDGNEIMANDIYTYLMSNKKSELETYRDIRS